MIDLDHYIAQAEVALKELFVAWEPKLMASFGVAKFDIKADSTVVTDLDKSFELAIKDVLRPLSTDIGFLGEEHGQEGATDTFWLIDPIDGTEQYLRGLNNCRTMLCLIVNNEAVYTYVYRFTTKDLFTAHKGRGSNKNGVLIITQPRPLGRSWVEFAYDLQDPMVINAMVAVDKVCRSVVCTKEFLNVVEGSIDAHIIYGAKGKVWDYAPRALLLQEVGLKVTNIGSDSYDYKTPGLIAARPEVYDELHNLLSPQA